MFAVQLRIGQRLAAEIAALLGLAVLAHDEDGSLNIRLIDGKDEGFEIRVLLAWPRQTRNRGRLRPHLIVLELLGSVAASATTTISPAAPVCALRNALKGRIQSAPRPPAGCGRGTSAGRPVLSSGFLGRFHAHRLGSARAAPAATSRHKPSFRIMVVSVSWLLHARVSSCVANDKQRHATNDGPGATDRGVTWSGQPARPQPALKPPAVARSRAVSARSI